MSKFLKGLCLAAVMAGPAVAEGYGLGRAALPEEIAAWDLDVGPDGAALPPGQGDAIVGEEIFAEKCAACHGDFAEGLDNWPELAGGIGTLANEDPVKTVGSYWPHLTTAYDYIRRSMPYGNAGTLSDDEVYAILAYILYSNDLIEDDFELSQTSLMEVALPNADGFIEDDRATVEYPLFQTEPCMADCKDSVEITMRASVLDVTPQEETPEEMTEAAAEEAAEEAPAKAEVATDPVIDADLAAAGEKVFRKCKSCHQVGENAKNKTGPHLNGIVGAGAAAVDGFKYSGALTDAAANGLVWTPEELEAFLLKPRSYLKGTRMSFNGLKKDADRAAVIEYLKTHGKQ